ncbi:hypothetical protein [Sediminicoccus sp. KRV36]|uniref:hypothetical protein n=1 Tax=Sediminicoccus sp. KRV36 TaxID=3133721 RepID=UPI00200DC0BB|nr:hypothetical protein [Sediminicoccus rosea]UPY39008.1 hypothetical protein LHU95_10045 [Sediminicoccus rosea]
MSGAPLRFVARAPRGLFGRVVKWLFWLVVLVPPLLMLGTCAGLQSFVFSEDPEVAGGALMFGAGALGVLWAIWFIGLPVMGLLMLLTRGKKLVIEQPGTIG